MARRDFYREQKFGVPQLPAARVYQERLATEKFVRVTPKPTPPPAPPPVPMRELAFPMFSSITAIERGMGFDSDEITYKGLVVRRLLYRDVPVFFSALGHCCSSLELLRKEVNRGN